MTATRRRPAQSGGTPAGKGVALVLVTVAIGAILLFNSFDNGGPLVASSGGGTKTGATSTTTAGTRITPTTAAEVAHPPAEVRVLVLNGVDPKKAIAGPVAKALQTANYTTLPAGDAKSTVVATAVYYQAGYKADADLIVSQLGYPATSVQPLPATLPAPLAGGIKNANVVVLVGPDVGAPGSGTTATTAAGN